MKKIFLIGVMAFAASSSAFASNNLAVQYAASKTVTAQWSGGDAVSSGGGNATITLDPNAAKTAVLSVQCNSKLGYAVRFHATNAQSESGSKMLLDGTGGSADKELTYSAVMNCDQFRPTSTIVTEALKLQSAADSLYVKFDGGGNVTPKTLAQANQVKLVLTLDAFDPAQKEAGAYSDIITADVTIK